MEDRKLKGRVLLIEDSEDQALLIRSWIESDLGLSVVHVADGSMARHFARYGEWNLVVSDIEIPGVLGVELVALFKEKNPSTPVILITAHEKMEYAVQALRNRADEMMIKPLDRDSFLRRAKELIANALPARRAGARSVLAIGAHPDDVEIGCGGTLLRHVREGDRVAILTLSGGERGGVVRERESESQSAATIIGAELVMGDLTDAAISEGPETITLIEEAIKRYDPSIVYTHTSNDGHQDHRNVHRATMVAAREVPNVYCYQAPSTSVDFRPNLFIDITAYVTGKLELIQAYNSQVSIRAYLEDDLIRATARYWGRFAGYNMVEPMEVVRQKS